jgi:hypothetical protein
VGSRDINASAASVNIAAFDAVVFIPSEPNAAVALVTNVTSLRSFAAASQNIALYRRLGRM